jgi:hypothetical protein
MSMNGRELFAWVKENGKQDARCTCYPRAAGSKPTPETLACPKHGEIVCMTCGAYGCDQHQKVEATHAS